MIFLLNSQVFCYLQQKAIEANVMDQNFLNHMYLTFMDIKHTNMIGKKEWYRET